MTRTRKRSGGGAIWARSLRAASDRLRAAGRDASGPRAREALPLPGKGGKEGGGAEGPGASADRESSPEAGGRGDDLGSASSSHPPLLADRPSPSPTSLPSPSHARLSLLRPSFHSVLPLSVLPLSLHLPLLHISPFSPLPPPPAFPLLSAPLLTPLPLVPFLSAPSPSPHISLLPQRPSPSSCRQLPHPSLANQATRSPA